MKAPELNFCKTTDVNGRIATIRLSRIFEICDKHELGILKRQQVVISQFFHTLREIKGAFLDFRFSSCIRYTRFINCEF